MGRTNVAWCSPFLKGEGAALIYPPVSKKAKKPTPTHTPSPTTTPTTTITTTTSLKMCAVSIEEKSGEMARSIRVASDGGAAGGEARTSEITFTPDSAASEASDILSVGKAAPATAVTTTKTQMASGKHKNRLIVASSTSRTAVANSSTPSTAVANSSADISLSTSTGKKPLLHSSSMSTTPCSASPSVSTSLLLQSHCSSNTCSAPSAGTTASASPSCLSPSSFSSFDSFYSFSPASIASSSASPSSSSACPASSSSARPASSFSSATSSSSVSAVSSSSSSSTLPSSSDSSNAVSTFAASAFFVEERKKGVIYIARLPPKMNRVSLRRYFECFGPLGRLHVAPLLGERNSSSNNNSPLRYRASRRRSHRGGGQTSGGRGGGGGRGGSSNDVAYGSEDEEREQFTGHQQQKKNRACHSVSVYRTKPFDVEYPGGAEAWLEFLSRKDARRVALLLDGQPVSSWAVGTGKTSSSSRSSRAIRAKARRYWSGDIWCLKYLKGFIWQQLIEEKLYSRRVREARLNVALSQIKRENALYVQLVEEQKQIEKIHEKRKAKLLLQQNQQSTTHAHEKNETETQTTPLGAGQFQEEVSKVPRTTTTTVSSGELNKEADVKKDGSSVTAKQVADNAIYTITKMSLLGGNLWDTSPPDAKLLQQRPSKRKKDVALKSKSITTPSTSTTSNNSSSSTTSNTSTITDTTSGTTNTRGGSLSNSSSCMGSYPTSSNSGSKLNNDHIEKASRLLLLLDGDAVATKKRKLSAVPGPNMKLPKSTQSHHSTALSAANLPVTTVSNKQSKGRRIASTRAPVDQKSEDFCTDLFNMF